MALVLQLPVKVFNPRHTCAVRVTVVGSVCLSVSHITYGASVRPENAVMHSAGNTHISIVHKI